MELHLRALEKMNPKAFGSKDLPGGEGQIILIFKFLKKEKAFVRLSLRSIPLVPKPLLWQASQARWRVYYLILIKKWNQYFKVIPTEKLS